MNNKVDMGHLPVGEMIVIILLREDTHHHLSIVNVILTLEHTVLTRMLLGITMLLILTTEMHIMVILPLQGTHMIMEGMNQPTLIIQDRFPVVMPYMHLI